uniref:Ubiquitin fusion degradation 1-like protein n=2 Tax=Triticinae TaxID=1648030 RepID=R7WCX0_AEGTA
MARLGLEEDDLVLMTSTSLPKATSVKLRPHTMDFLGAKDLKQLLEFNVRLNTPCVTVGDTIAVAEGDRRYLLDVVEAKPADAVSTLETDCEVDFSTPLDYVQPPAPVPAKVAAAPCQDCAHGGERRFVGVGMRMDGKPVEQTPAPVAGSSGKGKSSSEHVLRFFGGRGSVAVPPPGPKMAKKKVIKKC